MTAKLSLILFVAYVFVLLIAVSSVGVPPNDLPLFGGMFVIACVGWVLRYKHGRRWNVIWAIACLIAVIGAMLEIVAGSRLAQRRSQSQSANPAAMSPNRTPASENASTSSDKQPERSLEEAMEFAQKQYEERMRNPPTNPVRLPNYETGPGRPRPLNVNFYSIDPRFGSYLRCAYPVNESNYDQSKEPGWFHAALEQIRRTGPKKFPPLEWVAVCIQNRAEHKDASTFERSFKVGAIFKASDIFAAQSVDRLVADTPKDRHPFKFDEQQGTPREQQRWLIVERHSATNQTIK